MFVQDLSDLLGNTFGLRSTAYAYAGSGASGVYQYASELNGEWTEYLNEELSEKHDYRGMFTHMSYDVQTGVLRELKSATSYQEAQQQ